MKFNFDELTERKHTNSYKWDSIADEDIIPLWVADMDFKTAPSIIEILRERVDQGIFGYTKVPEEYYNAAIDWFKNNHGWLFNRDWVIYTSGVVPAISAIIKALTEPGDKVILQTPVYNCFFSSIRNNDCLPFENKLINKDNTYFIDFKDLEEKASDPNAKVMLLCNPHNPTGRVWTKEELMKIYEICKMNGVIVVSDEIHCELVYSPHKYIPFGSISPNAMASCVICVSPSKAFNIAGLQIANIICEDEAMRNKIDKAININEVCDVNPFGVLATIAAYRHGKEWLDELKKYLWENYQVVKQFIETHFPMLAVTKLEGTYLVWINFKPLQISSGELERIFLEKGKVWLNEGTMYGESGEGFMRINIACPRSRLLEGLKRMKRVVNELI